MRTLDKIQAISALSRADWALLYSVACDGLSHRGDPLARQHFERVRECAGRMRDLVDLDEQELRAVDEMARKNSEWNARQGRA